MISTILVVSARPVATCLVAGALKTLVDYQGGQRWLPALVDGGVTALVLAGSMLGIGGAVGGVRQASLAAPRPAQIAEPVPPAGIK